MAVGAASHDAMLRFTEKCSPEGARLVRGSDV